MRKFKPFRLIAGAVLVLLVSCKTHSEGLLDRLEDIGGLEKSATWL